MDAQPPALPDPSPQTRGMWWFFGCLSLALVVPIVLVMLAMAGILSKPKAPLRSLSSDFSAFALETRDHARNSESLQQAVGIPMKDIDTETNSIRWELGHSGAIIEFGMRGPKGEARIRAQARKRESQKWIYAVFEAELEDGTIIDLKPRQE